MPGKEYSQQAYQIRQQFEQLAISTDKEWQDEQASRFRYAYIDKVKQSLINIENPIERVVDILEVKLSEIQKIANGN